MRSVIVRRDAGMERLLESFTPPEREQFADYLDRLVDSIDRLVTELAAEPPAPAIALIADAGHVTGCQ